MKYTVGLAVFLLSVLAGFSVEGNFCSVSVDGLPDGWLTMNSNCINKMRNQIQKEVGASYTYLEMGAYFSSDTVNRPGFSEFFLSAAKEEREHAIKLIEYLTMRGKLHGDSSKATTGLITVPEIKTGTKWTGVSALEAALELETSVTKSIRDVIVECESGTGNDYHLVDYLTGVYLEEQYKGQRDLAGKLATLKKMQKAQGSLAEFLFDKNL